MPTMPLNTQWLSVQLHLGSLKGPLEVEVRANTPTALSH